jgi:GTP-binding protein LepA
MSENIRNFAIVAHIDHGKSTLADRLLELTGTVSKRNMVNQILDSNPIERERGITIKLAPVKMRYKRNGIEYILNLIDTPGHVDFSYEVSRSLAACEGIILVVDATQGIQAQTLAHMRIIKDKQLTVIAVINKIDLPTAEVVNVQNQLHEVFKIKKEDTIAISAKTGENIQLVLDAIIDKIPPPKNYLNYPFQSLVFSSVYNDHKGVISYIRVFQGQINSKTNLNLRFCASNTYINPSEIGCFNPKMTPVDKLVCGDVGYIATGLKDISLAKIGDTLIEADKNIQPMPGFIEPKPMVFMSLFPVINDEFNKLRQSLEKLHLTDSSFSYRLYPSSALGKGFLCGFLGLLHAEIVKERLEKEFDISVLSTSPQVEYKIYLKNKDIFTIQSSYQFPDPSTIEKIEEPYMYTMIFSPKDYLGIVLRLCEEKRGELITIEYSGNLVVISYLIPLSEMLIDFYDKLKTITSGFASMDYEFFEYRQVDLVKVDIHVNYLPVEAFSQLITRVSSRQTSIELLTKLKNLIPRHQFQIPLQAVIGGKIIARENISSYRKDVTAKLYGGDRTRKDKLLQAQKKGKRKMREIGKVSIPSDVFIKLYR